MQRALISDIRIVRLHNEKSLPLSTLEIALRAKAMFYQNRYLPGFESQISNNISL